MFQTFLLGMPPELRGGDGLEQAVADFLVVQLLAAATDVSITPVDDASSPLGLLKESVRRHGKRATLVVTVPVDATDANDALKQAAESLGHRLFIDELGSDEKLEHCRFAAVAYNRSEVAAADLFVVSGLLTRVRGNCGFRYEYGKWALDTANRESAAPGVSLRVKSCATTVITEYDAGAELFTMGSRTDADCKGAIAASVTAADLTSRDAFDAFQANLLGRAAFKLPQRNTAAYIKENSVKRAEIFRDLTAKPSAANMQRKVAAVAVTSLVVQLGPGVQPPQWSENTSGVVFLEHSAVKQSLAPISVPEANGSVTWASGLDDVHVVCVPHAQQA